MEFLSKIHRALLIRNILRPICVFVKSVPFGIHYEILLACNYANVVLLEKKVSRLLSEDGRNVRKILFFSFDLKQLRRFVC